MRTVPSLILSAGLIIAAFIYGGRYERSAADGAVATVDRWTGQVRICRPDFCFLPVDRQP